MSKPYTGLASAPAFRTEDDVLRMCYGKGEGGQDAEEAAAEPAMDAPARDSMPDTVEGLAAKLEAEHKKDILVQLCEEAGLDTDGNKADLALRLAEHHLSKQG